VDERRRSWLRECLEALAPASAVTASAYVRHLHETLLSLAVHGECVFVRRRAAQGLPAASTLRVRLVAPAEGRAQTAPQRFGFPPAEAAR
jgi:hypothetical protein